MACANPTELAEFLAAMLGGEVVAISDEAVDVRREGIWISAMEVPDYRPPTWPDGDAPKQIHLDLAVDDLDRTVAEAERLGANVGEIEPAPERWRVLFDPAGHPFCLTTQIPLKPSRQPQRYSRARKGSPAHASRLQLTVVRCPNRRSR